MADESAKLTRISQIVRLKVMLKKWQSVTVKKLDQPSVSGIPPTINQRLKFASNQSESDDDCPSSEAPPDVPKGYCPVYVGKEKRRFVIPTFYLELPVFGVLLKKAEEEFGFDHEGALALPCEVETFKYILQCMEKYKKGLIDEENPQLTMGIRISKPSRAFITEGHGRTKRVLLAPRGYVPVLVGVGDEWKRFMIHVTLLGDAKMLELLHVSAEEFGFHSPGVLKILYDAESFEKLMMLGDESDHRILRISRRICSFCSSETAK